VRFDHLSPSGVSSGSLFVESLAAEQHHVVVGLKILRDTSRHGHLGNAEKPFVSAPALISAAPSDIVSATLGHQHTIFLDSSGTVSRLGSNKKPQLDGIDAAGTYTTGDGDAWELLIAGNNASGQLGRDGGELLRASIFCSHLRRFSYCKWRVGASTFSRLSQFCLHPQRRSGTGGGMSTGIRA
jgi:protein ATS1